MPGLACTVAIPTRELFNGEVAYAQVPGVEGSFGVLPGHEFLLSMNKKGLLSLWIDSDGNNRREFLLCDGITEIFKDEVRILGRFGCDVKEIDADEVRQKAEELKAHIESLKDSTEEQDVVERENSQFKLEWYEYQLSYIDSTK
ncbi:MAG: ATP synthase F1 subunit epsilon [Eggerthellaceae bacterium]|nr:ATP synthase F1 subunit epsilon [Eggerthellaceae bacterium]